MPGNWKDGVDRPGGHVVVFGDLDVERHHNLCLSRTARTTPPPIDRATMCLIVELVVRGKRREYIYRVSDTRYRDTIDEEMILLQ